MALESNEYLAMFIDESKDHLQALNENLLKLENEPTNIEIVQEIFRSAHTLKGMAATMAFEDISALTHEMENVLDEVRNERLQVDTFTIDTLFKSLDVLESMVEDIVAGGTGQADVQQLVETLQAIVAGEAAAAASDDGQAISHFSLDEYQYSVLQQSLESNYLVFYIEVTLSKTCVLKAARAYMVFDLLERNGEVVKSSPSVEDLEQEKFEHTFSVYYISNMSEEQLQEQIANISEIEQVKVMPLTLEIIHDLRQNQQKQAQREVAAGSAAVQSVDRPATRQAAAVSQRTIRVDIERLDALMNLFSELLIDRVRLEALASEIKNTDLIDTVEHMSRVSSDLQNIVLRLRMVPVDTVFNRFPRMIRDLARSLNKKVELIITGADTELDRTVIDEIGDPLVHLLRNALDHGIESPHERIQKGKPEVGTVKLSAMHSGNHVFIEIEEDGRGIDREAIIEKAIAKNEITREQADAMSDDDVFQLLFSSGFSTAQEVSDVSGRGVGLDVVKSKINALGGQVSVQSELGVGTKFSVQLPLTLSIISAMLVRLGDERYAIPLSSIVETAIINKQDIKVVHGTQMIHFREHVIPIIALHDIFDIEAKRSSDMAEDELNVLIIRKADKLAAFIIDAFIGQQEIVLKSLGRYLANSFAISGATILGDGQVALIIDPNALVK